MIAATSRIFVLITMVIGLDLFWLESDDRGQQ